MDKTEELVSRYFWWPNLQRDVREYVSTCDACQRNKAINKRPAGLLQPIPTPADRWEQVTMDLITQLPRTKNGRDAIFVVVERLTKRVVIMATKTTVTAPELAKLFYDNIFKHHGLPSVIIRDRDPRFTSNFWQALFRCTGTTLAMSTSAHPQTDGQTERANRTVEEALRHLVNRRTDDWDEHLTAVEFACNNSCQASTGYTPFYLDSGRHPAVPTSITSQQQPAVQSVVDFIDALDEDIRKAKESLSAVLIKNFKRVNLCFSRPAMFATLQREQQNS